MSRAQGITDPVTELSRVASRYGQRRSVLDSRWRRGLRWCAPPELPPRFFGCGLRFAYRAFEIRVVDLPALRGQLLQAESIVRLDQNLQRSFDRRCAIVLFDRALRALGGRHVSAALQVV